MSSPKNGERANGDSNGDSNSAPNAWSRPLKTRPPPGLGGPSGNPSKANGEDPSMLRERFLHLTLSMVGHRVTVTQTNGAVLEGVFHTFTPFASQPADKRNKYVLKAVNVVKTADGDEATEIENGSTVIIPSEKVSEVNVHSIRLESGTKDSSAMFQTDTEISSTQKNKEHGLVAAGSAWTSAGGGSGNSRAEALAGGLEPGRKGFTPPSSGGLRGRIGEWDQFKANEELFDVKASYDENLYTTELDKSQIDSTKRREAARMAREIETTASSNIHLAEERNQKIQGDYDEEDLYSGVLTSKLEARSKSEAAAAKKMNYAAAAAKADTKTEPPGFAKSKGAKEEEKKDGKEEIETAVAEPEKTDEPTEESKGEPAEDSEKKEAAEKEGEPAKEEPEADAKDEEGKGKTGSKLSASAKEFSFNPTAKTFTPGGASTPAAPAPEQPAIDPNTGMPVIPQYMAGAAGPYMPHPMGQPGMMPMMNAYPMRYQQGPYPGMEQHMAPVHPQHVPQHLQQPPPPPPPPPPPQQQGQQQQATAQQTPAQSQPEGSSPVTPEEQPQAAEDQQSQPQQAQTQPQQAQLPSQPQPGAAPMQHYPPGGYYGMPMQPRPGPGAPHMGGYHTQMVGAPQQIPVVPGGYRHMYGMPQPPPQMRGPNGQPYYPSGPQHYQPYMMDGDDYRGGRGRGRGRGRGGKRGGRGGRGTYYSNGRSTPQQNGPPEAVTGSTPPPADPTPQEAAEGEQKAEKETSAE